MLGCVRRRRCAAIKLGRVFEETVAHPGKSCGSRLYARLPEPPGPCRVAHEGIEEFLRAGHLYQPGGRS
jgi:hypothetical protein